MTAILTEVHYLPDSWVGKAHTQQVSNQFSQIFPFKAVSNVKCLRKMQISYVKYILFSELFVQRINITTSYTIYTVFLASSQILGNCRFLP